MAISSNCLFHFTNSIDNLYGILKYNFHPRLCYEDIFKTLNMNYKDAGYFIPMVCFCDIPLSMAHEHITDYGGYGIGLCKDWGIKKGLNPVIYLTGDSYINYLLKELEIYAEVLLKDRKVDNEKSILHLIYEFYGFIKPYEGINLKTNKRKILYNEREWRYVPETVRDNAKCMYRLTKKEVEVFGKEAANVIMSREYPLVFNPDDIKYIIVQNDDEILELCSRIDNINKKYYSKKNKKLLITKITTSKKIAEDY